MKRFVLKMLNTIFNLFLFNEKIIKKLNLKSEVYSVKKKVKKKCPGGVREKQ
jgi:hypothetical protein